MVPLTPSTIRRTSRNGCICRIPSTMGKQSKILAEPSSVSKIVSKTAVPSTYRRVDLNGRIGLIAKLPPDGSSSFAKTEVLEKFGRQSQSMEPLDETNAEVRQ